MASAGPSTTTPIGPTSSGGTSFVNTDLEQVIQDVAGQLQSAEFESLTPEQQQATLQQFQELSQGLSGLRGQQAGLVTESQALGGTLADVAAQQRSIGLGETVDPRFQAFRASQMESLAASQQAQQARQSEFFTRRGLGSSAAALNQQNVLAQQFGREEQAITGQLGLQELGAQQQALQTSLGIGTQQAGLLGQQAGFMGQQAGLVGQQAGIAGQEFGVTQAGITSRNLAEQQRLEALAASIETLSLPEQLDIARTAAENAGKVPEAAEDQGLFGSGGFLGMGFSF